VVPDQFSAALAQLVYRMLAKDPDDRPTAAEVAGWTFAETPEMPTMDLEVLPRRNWRKPLAVAAAVVVAGAAMTAGVLTNQESNQPLAPANVTPSQPPRRPAATPRPTPTPTVTVTKAATRAQPRHAAHGPAAHDGGGKSTGKHKSKKSKH
ncbi:MAG: hypothetical protein HOV67_00060, partial [Kribbellaceae bacterium]|nr:hypothetical protein [Kribbellaceae bacterium]